MQVRIEEHVEAVGGRPATRRRAIVRGALLPAMLLAAILGRSVAADSDWMLVRGIYLAEVREDDERGELILSNGLVRRTFKLAPNAATISLDSYMTDASLLRAVRPEARVTLDGVAYDVGGLHGQPNLAYLRDEWVAGLEADPTAFRYVGYKVDRPEERMAWPRSRYRPKNTYWPTPGVRLRMDYIPGPESALADQPILISVYHELYDNIPLFSKWITVHNASDERIELDRFTSEILAAVEDGSQVDLRQGEPLPTPRALTVLTDYFGGTNLKNAERGSVHWKTDPLYTSQVNYRLQTPCLLEVEPVRGPDVFIEPKGTFESFRSWILVHDSTDRERRGLAIRKTYRTIAPWVTENPLILHVVSTDPEVVRRAIDQCVDCGFEMVSLSFGSGLDMEDESPDNLARFRALNEYATERGIQLGGYSLLASRRIQPDSDNAISPETGKSGGQVFGHAPALASDWGTQYFRKLRTFFSETGFLQFTHDGSYPGDVDAAARPPLQRGLDDSQWVQWRIITDFYRFLRERGAYVRVPDTYHLSGSNETGMGYREVNWSLPRAQQVIHTRQNIYDGTWQKTPSMGWMFVPLTQYHGGGAAATIEPLDQHLDHYERMLASNLGLGVQAVYRGHRLYDTPRVRDRVRHWVDWYKKYRDILESDVIHGRRADGRNIDWMLHVNPFIDYKGMLVVYNPLDRVVTRAITVDLTYTGLVDEAHMKVGADGGLEVVQLDRDGKVDIPVTVPARGMAWIAFM